MKTWRTRILTSGFALVALAFAAPEAMAQGSFQVDAELAKKGQSAWKRNACDGCHTIGKGKNAGPDLKDVFLRRDAEWIRMWLTDTGDMLESDSIAEAMVEEWDGARMPDMRLKKRTVEQLMHYIAQEGARMRAGGDE